MCLLTHNRSAHFALIMSQYENADEYAVAMHNGEEYRYKKLASFDDYGVPKPFQDCATILK